VKTVKLTREEVLRAVSKFAVKKSETKGSVFCRTVVQLSPFDGSIEAVVTIVETQVGHC
jgi:hypothetical protein